MGACLLPSKVKKEIQTVINKTINEVEKILLAMPQKGDKMEVILYKQRQPQIFTYTGHSDDSLTTSSASSEQETPRIKGGQDSKEAIAEMPSGRTPKLQECSRSDRSDSESNEREKRKKSRDRKKKRKEKKEHRDRVKTRTEEKEERNTMVKREESSSEEKKKEERREEREESEEKREIMIVLPKEIDDDEEAAKEKKVVESSANEDDFLGPPPTKSTKPEGKEKKDDSKEKGREREKEREKEETVKEVIEESEKKIEIASNGGIQALKGMEGILIELTAIVPPYKGSAERKIDLKIECPHFEPTRICVNGKWKSLQPS